MSPSADLSPQTGTKRKSLAAGISTSTRPVKRRASKACGCCRSRKVRCDVVESGIPCTNCRLDEVECQVTEGKRRKKSYVDGDILNHSPLESVEDKEDIQKFPLFDDIDGLEDLTTPTTQVKADSAPTSSFEYGFGQHRPHSIYQTQGYRLTPEERNRRVSLIGQPRPLSITPVQLPAHLQYCPSLSPRPEIVLPHYISPIPRQLLSEDLQYLQRKGAFNVPEVPIRNELLRSYVQYVHPYLPLLDLEEFLSAIDKNEPGSTVSLLLYHAVMFAASAYVDLRYLTAQGHSSRKAARKAYFQRVKLLYDFDWEIDRATVVQAVLLMTHWYESPNDPKDVWYWLGIAISIARTIGMNYSTEGTTILTPRKRRLWKRIWWCTYLRDRVIAIGMRRPIRIRDEDFDIPMLQIEDFETDALPPDLCRMLGGCSAVRDSSKRITLAKMCIALTEVCRHISDILTLQYSVLGHRIGVTTETSVRLVPKNTGAKSADIMRCDQELEGWYKSLPLELRYFKSSHQERTTNHDGEVICVHRALLTAVYLTATSALHRPQMMPAMPNMIIALELKELSRQRVHDAALDITEIYRDLYAHDLIRYLPNTGVTVLLPAIIVHLLDIKTQDGADKQASIRHFQFCMQALQKLRDLYASADFSFSYLDAAIRKADIIDEDGRSGLRSSSPVQHGSTFTRPASSAFKSAHNDITLTPPPENQDSCSKRDDQSTLTSSHLRSNALTPPTSDHYSQTVIAGGNAINLKDLERFAEISELQNLDHNTFASFPDPDFHAGHAVNIEQNNFGLSTHNTHFMADNEMNVMNQFDQLINFEGGPDLFAPNQVSIDDSLFKDIDMEWLADPVDESVGNSHVDAEATETGRKGEYENRQGTEQSTTPPTALTLSPAGSDGNDHRLQKSQPLDHVNEDISTPPKAHHASDDEGMAAVQQVNTVEDARSEDVEVDTGIGNAAPKA